MGAVRVGVGEDADLAVAQAVASCPSRDRPRGPRRCRAPPASRAPREGSTSQVFRILPRSGRIAWNSLLARLLGRAAGRVALDQEELGEAEVLAGAVGELAGQGGAGGHRLALDLLAGAQARLGAVDRQAGDPLGVGRVLVEPEGEGVLGDAGDEGRRLARGEALLGLAGELRVLHPHREDVAAARPDVLRRELDAARQQVAELAELADGVGQAGAEAVDVRAPLRRRDQVDVALAHARRRLLLLGEPAPPPSRPLRPGRGSGR